MSKLRLKRWNAFLISAVVTFVVMTLIMGTPSTYEDWIYSLGVRLAFSIGLGVSFARTIKSKNREQKQ